LKSIFFVIFLVSCSQFQAKKDVKKTGSSSIKQGCSQKTIESLISLEKKLDTHWVQLGDCYLKGKDFKKAHYIYNLLSQTGKDPIKKQYAKSMGLVVEYLLGQKVNSSELKVILQNNQVSLITISKILLEEGKLSEAANYIKKVEQDNFEKKWLWSIYYYLNGDNEKALSFISKLKEGDIYRNKMMKNYIQILKDINQEDKANQLEVKYSINREQV